MTTIPTLDTDSALGWYQRWERQQEGYVPDREEAFGLMLDVVERLVGAPRRVLDLGSGPGCLAARARTRFPAAEVVALDLDPVLVEIGRAVHGDGVRWVEEDLREPGWESALERGSFDVVLSATALHYLDAERIRHVATGLARLLAPGGVFVDCDTMLVDSTTPRLAALVEAMRREEWERRFAEREDFYAWWDAVALDPALAPLLAERARRFGARRFEQETEVGTRVAALLEAGFAEVAPVAQRLDKRVLVAIR